MAFDPDAFLQQQAEFDPDEFLKPAEKTNNWALFKKGEDQKEYSALETPLYAAGNLIPSTAKVGVDIASAIAPWNIKDTTQGTINALSGYMQKALPDSFNQWSQKRYEQGAEKYANEATKFADLSRQYKDKGDLDTGIRYEKLAKDASNNSFEMMNKYAVQVGTADALNNHYKEKYGSWENAKKAMAEDPASVILDASAILRGGAGIVGVGNKISTVGNVTSKLQPQMIKLAEIAEAPMMKTFKGLETGLKTTGELTLDALDWIGPKVGKDAIKEAWKAGRDKNLDFIENMRNESNIDEVVGTARDMVNQLKIEKNKTYQQAAKELGEDTKALSFDEIDKAMEVFKNQVYYKGIAKSPQLTKVYNEIEKTIQAYKNKELNTSIDLDNLKQSIYSSIESLPFEATQARTLSGDIPRAIGKTIRKQAPLYDKMMSDYSKQQQFINEVEKALSLGKRASADTALRKLQSVMRNNVNTNYGKRIQLLDDLEKQTGKTIKPQIAGQQFSSWTPRGIKSALGGLIPLAGGVGLGLAPAVGLGLSQSPRLIGEALYGAGRATKLLDKATGGVTGKTAKMYKDILSKKGSPALLKIIADMQKEDLLK